MYWFLIILATLMTLYFLLILIYLYGWLKLPVFKIIGGRTPETMVTVIIPARNEEDNIQSVLKAILRNNYPKELLEVLVIDDFSTDNTVKIAEEMLPPENGRVLKLKNYLKPEERLNSYKKMALSIAIAEAKGKLIITTDADCTCSRSWLRQIVGLYEESKAKAIVAPVSFISPNRKGLLYYFQSLDFMMMQGITAAGIRLGFGSMCNGANFAFEKAVFEEVGGYKGIDNIASGDDMLLLHKIKKAYPDSIRYIKNKEAMIETYSQPTMSTFINQRIRWASKSDKYDDKSMIATLLLVYLLNLCFPTIIIVAFIFPVFWLVLLDWLIVKVLVEAIFLIPVAYFYKKDAELWVFPFLQPFHALYIISVGFLGKFGSYKWKGRSVH